MADTQRKYIGARYVPLIMGEWNSSATYEPLSVVLYEGNSYTSRTFVPAGIPIDNEVYWALSGNYQASADGYAKSYDTVADMQADTTLTAGMICHTLGFHAAGDGGAAWYKVESTGTANGMDVLALSSGIAVLQIDDTYNPCQYGADSTGTNDSADAINAFIQDNEGENIVFFNGKYKLNSPIVTDYEQTTSIDFNGSKLITDSSCDCALYVGYRNATSAHAGGANGLQDKYPDRCAYFKNVYIESHGNYAIRVKAWYMNARFNNITCYCYKNGIQDGESKGHPIDSLFDNVFLCNDDMNEDYTGFEIYGSDSKYINIRIYAFKVGITSYVPITLDNVHFLATNVSNIVDFNNDFVAILFKAHTSDSQIMNCYCDSYNTFIKVEGQHFLICNIQNFKMTQWKQMDSGHGIVVDLLEADDFAHSININSAIVNNDNGKYNKFRFIEAALKTLKDLYSSSEFNNIVINNNDSSKFYMNDGVLSQNECVLITKNNLNSISNWFLVGHIATSDAYTQATVLTRNPQNGVTGVFRIAFDENGAPTSIIRWSEGGGHPRIGCVETSDGWDLYYTETQGSFYTTLQVEFVTNFYRLVPANNLIYMTNPTTTSTEPTVVSPLYV